MKKEIVISGLAMWLGLHAAQCAASAEPTQAQFAAALEQHLARRGDICIGKNAWPIEVSEQDIANGSKNAVQMPFLEKLGLVAAVSSGVQPEAGNADVKRYVLTDEGKQYYRPMPLLALPNSTEPPVQQNDFCLAKLSVDRIVRWDAPTIDRDRQATVVTYTYKVAAPAWVRDPELRNFFPMVDRIVRGEGTMQLKQRFRLVDEQWVAINPWE